MIFIIILLIIITFIEVFKYNLRGSTYIQLLLYCTRDIFGTAKDLMPQTRTIDLLSLSMLSYRLLK